MRKRPFLLLAGMYLLGILCTAWHLPVLILPAGLLWLYTMPWKERGMRRMLFAAALPCMFLLGSIQMQRELAFRQQYMQDLTEDQSVCLVGKITRMEQKSVCVYYYLDDCAVKTAHGTYPCNGVIAYVSSADHSIGQILKIKGTISFFKAATNEGMFDARQFYQSQKIDFGVWVTAVACVSQGQDSYQERLDRLRVRMQRVLSASIKDDGVLSAMLLGEKGELDAQVKSLYQRAGIAHILAISGLHISLLGMGLYRLLRKRLLCSYRTAAMATAVFLLSYATLSGNGIATRRAVGMCLLYLLSDVTGHAYDLLNALGLTVLVLLFQNPFLVGFSGFVFSVTAVLAIGVGGTVFVDWRSLADQERFRKQREGLWVSFAIQLFTLPVVASCYYEIPVYALAVNLVVLLFVPYLLGLTAVGVITGLFSLHLARVLFRPCGWILAVYRRLCGWAVQLPGAQWIVGRPTAGRIVWYAMGLMGLFGILFLQTRRQKRADTGQEDAHKGPSAKQVCASILTGVLLLAFLFFPQKNAFEIDFLDVGQGDGIYLCTGTGTSLFIDGGSTDVKQVGTYRILPFLKAKGVKTVSYWFVTHTDQDHISGLEEVLASGYRVGHLVFAKAVQAEERTKKLAKLAEKAGTAVIYMKEMDVLFCGNARMKCLYPKAEEPQQGDNDRCLVLQYEEGDVRALFAGDISEAVEQTLLERDNIGPVVVYKANHHGSRYSNSAAWMQALRPQVSVVSAGKNNRYGHPGREAVARILESGSQLYQTSEGGRIRVRVLDGKLVCEPFLSTCCTGQGTARQPSGHSCVRFLPLFHSPRRRGLPA